MSYPATQRLKTWYESHEIHFAVARPGGDVQVGVAPRAQFLEDDLLQLTVPERVWEIVAPFLVESPWIALHPGGLGAVKAPYQAKGIAAVSEATTTEDASVLLTISLKELYITKPGPEAGARVDGWTVEQLTEFERTLGWLEDDAK